MWICLWVGVEKKTSNFLILEQLLKKGYLNSIIAWTKIFSIKTHPFGFHENRTQPISFDVIIENVILARAVTDGVFAVCSSGSCIYFAWLIGSFGKLIQLSKKSLRYEMKYFEIQVYEWIFQKYFLGCLGNIGLWPWLNFQHTVGLQSTSKKLW